MKRNRTGWLPALRTTALALAIVTSGGAALADTNVGQEGPLFESIDEDLEPVNMADFIDGKPLVLVVSSAS